MQKLQLADREDYQKMANDALSLIAKNNVASLKSIYRKLFKRIVVSSLDQGNIQLEFVLNDPPSNPAIDEAFFCTVVGLERVTRLERAAFCMASRRSTN